MPAGPDEQKSSDDSVLAELMTETRILLPGTEVFLAFLATVPFSNRFGELDSLRRTVYICTFLATLLSLILFVVPATYHRIARPIHRKQQFKVFANRFLVAGLVPMSISMVLASYLVTYVVVDRAANYVGGFIAALILTVWWIVPLLRAHHLASEGPEDASETGRLQPREG